METAIITSLIAGCFSLATALGTVWLKHYLETRTPSSTPVQASPRPPAPPSPPTFGRPSAILVRATAVVAIGFILGAASRVIRDAIPGPVHYEAIVSLAVLVVVSALLAFSHRRARNSMWVYQLEVFSLWAAFESGWSLVNGGIWSDALFAFGAWWLGCAVLGAVLVRARTRSAA